MALCTLLSDMWLKALNGQPRRITGYKRVCRTSPRWPAEPWCSGFIIAHGTSVKSQRSLLELCCTIFNYSWYTGTISTHGKNLSSHNIDDVFTCMVQCGHFAKKKNSIEWHFTLTKTPPHPALTTHFRVVFLSETQQDYTHLTCTTKHTCSNLSRATSAQVV